LFDFFVAGTGLGEFDCDFALGSKRAGHEVGEVGDEMRDGKDGRKQGRRMGMRRGGEQQIDGFSERKEVATGGGIGDGDGTTAGDLAGEYLSHAIARGEDVAEA